LRPGGGIRWPGLLKYPRAAAHCAVSVCPYPCHVRAATASSHLSMMALVGTDDEVGLRAWGHRVHRRRLNNFPKRRGPNARLMLFHRPGPPRAVTSHPRRATRQPAHFWERLHADWRWRRRVKKVGLLQTLNCCPLRQRRSVVRHSDSAGRYLRQPLALARTSRLYDRWCDST